MKFAVACFHRRSIPQRRDKPSSKSVREEPGIQGDRSANRKGISSKILASLIAGTNGAIPEKKSPVKAARLNHKVRNY